MQSQTNRTTKRNIAFGFGDDTAIMNPLIPFNCVYDIDFGLIRYMYENGYTTNNDLVDPGFFTLLYYDRKKMVSQLYTRKEENPLKLCLRNTEDADDLYNQFMESDYGRIIRSSVRTGIYEMCELFKDQNTIRAGIIYSSEAEYYMLSNDENLKHIELVDLETVKHRINDFSIYFFKSTQDMYIDLLTPLLRTKSIYILDYRFNFNEDDTKLRDSSYIGELVLNRNVINIISAYDRERLGMEESNEPLSQQDI